MDYGSVVSTTIKLLCWALLVLCVMGVLCILLTDTSSLTDVSNCVIAYYGHTSIFDGVMALYISRMLRCKILVADHHKAKVPSLLRDNIIFVRKDGTNIFPVAEQGNVGFAIEGTRKYRPYVHQGFYHYAAREKKNIVFMFVNYRTLTIECSQEIHPNEVTVVDALDILKNFVGNKTFAIFPQSCGKIALK